MKASSLVLAAVLCATLAACGGGGDDSNPPEVDAQAEWAKTCKPGETYPFYDLAFASYGVLTCPSRQPAPTPTVHR